MICINIEPLPENEVAPPLELNKEYSVIQTYICKCGEGHYDVGLKSKYNWIRCYKCKREIPKGDSIHWAHPSRFK
jgi:hypothetical protein